MREILFRGFHPNESGEQKAFVNGEWVKGYWVYGYYASKKETTYAVEEDYKKHPVKTEHFIIVEQMTDWGLPNKFLLYPVIPESVGWYTGLKDKNGKKIFVGDITDFKTTSFNFRNTRIIYSCEYVRFLAIDTSQLPLPMDSTFQYSVIGNIFENPELLKGDEE